MSRGFYTAEVATIFSLLVTAHLLEVFSDINTNAQILRGYLSNKMEIRNLVTHEFATK